jgi:hypothetical protein
VLDEHLPEVAEELVAECLELLCRQATASEVAREIPRLLPELERGGLLLSESAARGLADMRRENQLYGVINAAALGTRAYNRFAWRYRRARHYRLTS